MLIIIDSQSLKGRCKGTSASPGSARFGISISLLGPRHARADGPFIPPFHSPCFSSFPSFPSPRFLLLIYTPFLLLDDDSGLLFPRRHTVYILLYLRARLPSFSRYRDSTYSSRVSTLSCALLLAHPPRSSTLDLRDTGRAPKGLTSPASGSLARAVKYISVRAYWFSEESLPAGSFGGLHSLCS